jgi:chemotaxis protein MotB
MQALIAEKGLNGKIHLESASSGFVISIADMVSFDSGTADLRHEARPILDALALLVQSRPDLRVEVSGHTDRRRIATAKFPSNWELSTARASRAARYLIEKGVDPSRIEARGFANQRPRAPETDPASGRANRRVEIRLYQPAQPTATDSTPEHPSKKSGNGT